MAKDKKILFTIFFWIVNLTGGALLTIPGLVITGIAALFFKGKVYRNGCSYTVELPGDGGGLEIGAVSLVGGYSKTNPYGFEHTRCHEFGHNIQQLIFGPFQIFVSGASVVRYGIFRYRQWKKLPNPEYDAAGFEGTATRWGTYWVNKLEK